MNDAKYVSVPRKGKEQNENVDKNHSHREGEDIAVNVEHNKI